MKGMPTILVVLVLALGCGWMNRNLHPEDQARTYRNAGIAAGEAYAEGRSPERLFGLMEDCAKAALWIGGATVETEQPELSAQITLTELDINLTGDLAQFVKDTVLRFLAGQVVDKQARVNAQQFLLGVATALKHAYQESYDGSTDN